MRLLYLFLFSCFLGYAQKQDFAVTKIPKELLENADAVFRQDLMEIEINSIKNKTTRITNVWTVLNKQGEDLINNSIYYDNAIKINKAEVKIYNASGKEIKKYKKNEFRDRSSVSSGTLYSDARVLYVDYTPTSYPYTFEISYETSSKNTVYLPSFSFLSGYRLSTEISEIIINYNHEEIKINALEEFLENYSISKQKKPGFIKYSAKNLKALKHEAYAPYFFEVAPKVKFYPENFTYAGIAGEAKTWTELGQWFYNNILKNRDKLSEETLQEVKQLVQGVEDPIERAKIVYEYVQNNTRYISVQVGIGGIQPITAAEVDRVKYGDCKGLSNYTKALLEAVGVNAYYTHIEAGNIQYSFNENYPSLAEGNHVILAIPDGDDYIFTDCTSQVHPFGFIGDFSDNRYAHVIKPDGGELVKTTAYLNEDNHESFAIKAALDKDGNLAASLDITSKGLDYDRKFLLPTYTNQEIDVHYKKRWNHIRNLKLNHVAFENDKKEIVFKEQIEITANNYASKSGNRLLLEINPFAKQNSLPPRHENRNLPIDIKRGYYETATYEFKLPEGYKIEAMPTVFNKSTPFGDYQVSIQKNENHSLTFTRSFSLKQGTYPKESYSDFREFLSYAALQDNIKIILIKI